MRNEWRAGMCFLSFALYQQQDNLQKYEILVRSSGVKRKLSVEAPALGVLQNQSENLAFSNDFGVQSVDLSASGEEKQSEETAFYGTICITAKDVAQAKPVMSSICFSGHQP